ncbi:hypothetical protein [Sinorhizobium garamanticum]|uniref:hypothetical protein n=1 Tax=Sinorhizobium garamanticum TaxID=680247 RepID=UPI003CC8D876
MDQLEELLQSRLWLWGDVLTVVDIQMFTSLVRFDVVYHTLFKCNWKRAFDYRQLWSLVRRIYCLPGVADTVRVDDIATHYYKSLPDLNPRGIVPCGPDILAILRGARRLLDSAQHSESTMRNLARGLGIW